MINTIYGEMDENDLEKRSGVDENDDEKISWVEYWLNDEMVHRSVHVHLKKNVMSELFAQPIG